MRFNINKHEKIYRYKLSNGLNFILIPKQEYNKVYATMSVNFGSLDNTFIPKGKKNFKRFPLGIAHFIEHKIFEMKDHKDASIIFSKQGANSNAFTSYSITTYLFSSTNNVLDNLDLLLEFTNSNDYSEETINNEKKIIEQELLMYLDDPELKIQNTLISNLFFKNDILYDIGGTVDSIKEINKKLMDECFNTFYNPSNMVLIVVGNFDVTKVKYLVKKFYKNKDEKPFDIKRKYFYEDSKIVRKKSKIYLDIPQPKFTIGIKIPYEELEPLERYKKELLINIYLNYLFGDTSNYYNELLNEDLINDSFSYYLVNEDSASYIAIESFSNNINKAIKKIKEILLEDHKIDKKEFTIIKNDLIGKFILSLNSLEAIASNYSRFFFKNLDFFQVPKIIYNLKYEDLENIKKYFNEDSLSIVEAFRKEDK